MTTNTSSSQLLRFPNDILLEILAQLPAFQVVLRCRLVCRKIEQLSREWYLWIRFSRRAEHMPCPPINPDQIGSSELEINICRIEMLEEKWSDEEVLRTVPHFWRGAPRRIWVFGDNRAMMGDNLVLIQEDALNWIPIQNINGPPLYSFPFPSIEGQLTFMDYTNLKTSTLYLVHLLQDSIKIVGIWANLPHGLHVVVEYSFPLRNLKRIMSRVHNGIVSVYYTQTNMVPLEVDIIDLEERTLFRLSLPSFLHIDDPHGYMHFLFETFVTEKHIMEIFADEWFAIFNRPAHGHKAQESNADVGTPPLEVMSLDPVFKGRFPWPVDHYLHDIPRSATSFAVVATHTETMAEIYVFLFTILGTGTTFEDICSVKVGMSRFCNLVLPIPPPKSRYALGVLGLIELVPREGFLSDEERQRTHFAVRIDFPESEGDLASGNKGSVTLQRMHLTPAADVQEEDAEVCFFDCLTGRVWFNVVSNRGMFDVILDYLSLT